MPTPVSPKAGGGAGGPLPEVEKECLAAILGDDDTVEAATLVRVWDTWAAVRIPLYSSDGSCAPEQYLVSLLQAGTQTECRVGRADLRRQRGVLILRRLTPGTKYTVQIRTQKSDAMQTLDFTTFAGLNARQGVVSPDVLQVKWWLATGEHDASSVPEIQRVHLMCVARPDHCLKVRVAEKVVPVEAGQKQGEIIVDGLAVNRAFFVCCRAALAEHDSVLATSECFTSFRVGEGTCLVQALRPKPPEIVTTAPMSSEMVSSSLAAAADDELQRRGGGSQEINLNTVPRSPSAVLNEYAQQYAAEAERVDALTRTPPQEEPPKELMWGVWGGEVRMLTLQDAAAQVVAVGADFVRVNWRRPAGCRAHGTAEVDVHFDPEGDLRVPAMQVNVWQDPTPHILRNQERRRRGRRGHRKELFRAAETWTEPHTHSQNSNQVTGLPSDSVFFMTISYRNVCGEWSPPQRLRFATLKEAVVSSMRIGTDSADVALVQPPRKMLKFCNIDVRYPEPTIWPTHNMGMMDSKPAKFDPQRPYTGPDTRRLPDSERWVNVNCTDAPDRYAVRCIDIGSGRVSVFSCSAQEGQASAKGVNWGSDEGMPGSPMSPGMPLGSASVHVRGLRPGAAYIISARSRCGDWGGWASPILITTPRTLRVRVVSRSHDSLEVSWGLPQPPPALSIPTLQGLLDPKPGLAKVPEGDITGIRSLLPEAREAARDSAVSWARWADQLHHLARLDTGSDSVYYYEEWEQGVPQVPWSPGGGRSVRAANTDDEDDADSDCPVYRSSGVAVGARSERDVRRYHAHAALWPNAFVKVKRVKRRVPACKPCTAAITYERVRAVRLTIWREGGVLPADDKRPSEHFSIIPNMPPGGADEPSGAGPCRQTVTLWGDRGRHTFGCLPPFTLHSIAVSVPILSQASRPDGPWRPVHTIAVRTLLLDTRAGILRVKAPMPPAAEKAGVDGTPNGQQAPSSPVAYTEPVWYGGGDAEADYVWDCDEVQPAPLPRDEGPSLVLSTVSEAYAGFCWTLPAAAVTSAVTSVGEPLGGLAGLLRQLTASVGARKAQQRRMKSIANESQPLGLKQWTETSDPARWQTPASPQQQQTRTEVGPTREYRMRVAQVTSPPSGRQSGDPVREIYFRSVTNSVHIAGLFPDQSYEVDIAVFDPVAGGWSLASSPCSLTSLRPTSLRISDLHKDLVSFQWEREKPAGTEDPMTAVAVRVTCFRVNIQADPVPNRDEEPEDIELRVVNSNSCSHHLYSLRPSTPYSVSVCPLYSGGLWGTPSPPIRFFYSYIAPKVVSLTHDNLHLTWDHPVNDFLPRSAKAAAEQERGWVGKLILQVTGEAMEECVELPPTATDYHLSALKPASEYTLTLVFTHQICALNWGEELPRPPGGSLEPFRMKVLTHSVEVPTLDSVGEDFGVVSCAVQLFHKDAAHEQRHGAQKTTKVPTSHISVPSEEEDGFGYQEESQQTAERKGVVRMPEQGALEHGAVVLQLRVSQVMTGTSRIDSHSVAALDKDAHATVTPVLQDIGGLRPNTHYSVQYRQELACGALSSWSDALRVSTLPPLVPSVQHVGEEFVRLAWQRAPGLEEYIRHMPQVYQICVTEVGLRPEAHVAMPLLSPKVRRSVTSSNTNEATTTLTTGYTSILVEELKPRTAYRAKARQKTSERADAWGVWSHEILFTTLPQMKPRVLCKGAHYIEFCWEREKRSAEQPTHPLVADAYDEQRQRTLSPLVGAMVQIVDYVSGEVVDSGDVKCDESTPSSRIYATRSELCHGTVYALRVRMMYDVESPVRGERESKESSWTQAVHVPTLATACVRIDEIGETHAVLSWVVPRPDRAELEERMADAEGRRLVAQPQGRLSIKPP
eukprot:Hpha_TRINITY_DN15231_c1_g12::TRINITY_DN15231_c1_g12_i1::g.67640::m.67640